MEYSHGDNYCIEIIQFAEEIRNHLGVRHEDFLKKENYLTGDAKNYYLYGCCQHLVEVYAYLVQSYEYMKDSTLSRRLDKNSEPIVSSVLRGMHLWLRRSIELTAALVLFDTTNQEEYYAHYLLIQRYDYYLRVFNDYSKYFERMSVGFQQKLQKAHDQLKVAQNNVNPSLSWYLNAGGRKGIASNPHVVIKKTEHFANLLDQALTHVRYQERPFLGRSYMGMFGMSSSVIHYMGARVNDEVEAADIESISGALRLQQHYISYRIGVLIGANLPPSIANLHTVYSSSQLEEINNLDKRLGASVGDYVYIFRRVGRISAIHKSSYGYISYEVDRIAGPAFPFGDKDWFRAENLLVIDFGQLERDTLTQCMGETKIRGYSHKIFFSEKLYEKVMIEIAVRRYDDRYKSVHIDTRYYKT